MKHVAQQIGTISMTAALLLGAAACSDEALSRSPDLAQDPSATGSPEAPAPRGADAPAASKPPSLGASNSGAAPNETTTTPMFGGGSSSNGSGAAPGGSSSSPGGANSPAPSNPPPSGSSAALIRGDAPSLESATSAGPFEVNRFTDGLRDGPDYGSQTLYAPSGAEPPFAGVAIVPGFISPESSIADWGPFLASHGIATLTIGTNAPTDSPDQRAQALLDALETIKAENTRADSPLAGKLDVQRLGVMGWSMGGGGTLIASSQTPSLKAAVTLAAWSPGVSFSNEQVPTLLFAGSADTLAGGQSQGFFTSIPDSTPKMLFEVSGGSHSVANSPSSANGEVGRYGLSWLKVFLEGDDRYRQFLAQEPTRQSDFRQNLSNP